MTTTLQDEATSPTGDNDASHRILHSRLFAIITVIERELARLPEPTGDEHTTLTELRAYWTELRALLVTEPLPKLRECPTCKHLGIATATRCGYCWTKLVPAEAARSEPQG